MDWSTIQTGIKSWFSTGTGLTVVWMNEAKPMTDKPYGILQILSSSAIGKDEVNYEYISTGTPHMEPTVSGVRQLTISCQVISRNQLAGSHAMSYLESARTDLRRPTAREALYTAGLGILSTSPTVVLDTRFDKRMESRASFDVTFTLAENVTYADDADGTSWIERAEVSSDFEPTDDASSVELDEEVYGII